MDYTEALKNIVSYVVDRYGNNNDERLAYHNYNHTRELVAAVHKIADSGALDEYNRFISSAAAWFYNTGYLKAGTVDFKTESASVAEQYLSGIGIDKPVISDIKKCILSTQLPQRPETKAEEVLCDAVMYYLGTKDFSDRNKLLRKETELLGGIKISGSEWRSKTISLMKSHRYFTPFCQQELAATKNENLHKLILKQQEETTPVVAENLLHGSPTSMNQLSGNAMLLPGNETAAGSQQKIKSGKKKDKPGRGIETLFRISTTNHQRLSAMADNKAHIMISVNSIIISAVLALVIRNLDSVPYLLVPTVMLLFVSVTTIIFSILATRPQLPSGLFTKEQIAKRDVDLSFFGNYYKMNFDDYDAGMKKLMVDKEFLYGSLTRNLHGHAKVLGRKFRLLRISYDVFMFGLVITVLTYILILLLNR